MTETQINDYLSYGEAVREAIKPGYKSDWPDTNPVEDSVQPVNEDAIPDYEQPEDQTSEPEE